VQTCIWPSWCHCHSLSLASVKSRLVLPFWYRLTWVVPEKGPLNGRVRLCVLVYLPVSYWDCITYIHPFNGLFSGTTQVSRYQKRKTNLDFTEARDSEWQWHQLGHMQVCTSLQTYDHASTSPLSFLQAGCPSCRPTDSVKALKALGLYNIRLNLIIFFLGPGTLQKT